MTNFNNAADRFHNLCIGHCNIQGGLLNLGKSNELSQLIRDHKLDILSQNEMNLNDTGWAKSQFTYVGSYRAMF